MSRFRKLLVPVDFSDSADLALHQAGEIAARADAELLVLHVVDLPTYAVDAGLGLVPPNMVEEVAPEVEGRLQSLIRTHLDAAIRARPLVRDGSAWREICQVVEDEAVDLIVMPTHGRTGLAHLLLGSTAERVVRAAPCPVLVVRPDVPRHDPPRVLIPVDLDDTADGPIAAAVDLVGDAADVRLLHVVDRPYTIELGLGVVPPGMVAEIVADVETRLQKIAADRPVSREVAEGVPHAEILAAIERDEIEFVVMPTHGRKGLAHLVLGSVAERVVRGAPCHVLVIRPASGR